MDADLIANAINGLKGRDWYDYFIGGSTVAISACTLIVALFISLKLSLKGRLLEKQLKTVFKLIDELQNLTLHIGVKGLGENMPMTTIGHFIRFFELAKHKPPKLGTALEVKTALLFTWKGWDELTFTSYADNPYTPPEIAEAISRFRIEGGLVRADEKALSQVVTILSVAAYSPGRQMKNEHDNTADHELWRIDGPPILKDFKAFHDACVALSKSINAWLKRYEADGLNLK